MDECVLVENLKKGEQDGFVAVYRYFYKPLHLFILRYVKNSERTEEILTDVFMKVWTRRMEFHSPDNLRAFLYIAAKNASLNALRDNKVNLASAPLSEIENLWAEDSDLFTRMVHVELLQVIFAEVERLPERQRAVFNLTFREDKTVDEIAEALNMSPEAVYANRSRAIHTLRQWMKMKNALPMLSLLQLLVR
ncbi:RNA polymerase sigma factor [Sphingobacterium sp. Mn56C]|uniref:RNA polymerase sigma factor n=1 Tax=Sphingobacterium sp. Mn56C TaxID=3395261 RepID=UPI003BE0F457